MGHLNNKQQIRFNKQATSERCCLYALKIMVLVSDVCIAISIECFFLIVFLLLRIKWTFSVVFFIHGHQSFIWVYRLFPASVFARFHAVFSSIFIRTTSQKIVKSFANLLFSLHQSFQRKITRISIEFSYKQYSPDRRNICEVMFTVDKTLFSFVSLFLRLNSI